MTDHDRMEFLESLRCTGSALVEDDYGNFAVMQNGDQLLSPGPGTEGWYTSYWALPGFEHEILWRATAREAIDAAIMAAKEDRHD